MVALVIGLSLLAPRAALADHGECAWEEDLAGVPIAPDSWLCGTHVIHGTVPPPWGYGPPPASAAATARDLGLEVVTVSAPSAGPTAASRPVVTTFQSTGGAAGCGSRGGPAYRLANGRCASWADFNAGRR
jgi:hypothetical protein